MSDTHDVSKMVGIYKKLFLILALVTAVGIAIAFMRLPVWVAIVLALAIIAIKGKVVLDSFQHLLTGRNALIILFGLTAVFFVVLILAPVLNHSNYITGTQDISKELQAQQPAVGPHGD